MILECLLITMAKMGKGWLCIYSISGLHQNLSAVVVGRRHNNGNELAYVMPTTAERNNANKGGKTKQAYAS